MYSALLSSAVEQVLLVAEFWYNNMTYSALGRSPFEVLYGYSPRQLGIANLQLCYVPDLEQWLKDIELLSQLVRQQLLQAQQRRNPKLTSTGPNENFKLEILCF
jgi:hypothetical protein